MTTVQAPTRAPSRTPSRVFAAAAAVFGTAVVALAAHLASTALSGGPVAIVFPAMLPLASVAIFLALVGAALLWASRASRPKADREELQRNFEEAWRGEHQGRRNRAAAALYVFIPFGMPIAAIVTAVVLFAAIYGGAR